MNESLTSLARFLLENDNYAIGIHQNPDGDCFGSACGLCAVLEKFDKKACIVSPSIVPERLLFLNYSNVKVLCEQEEYAKYADTFKTHITIDTASGHLLGNLSDAFEEKLNFAIDHHQNNTLCTPRLYLESDASSTGEIIYKLIKELEEWTDKHLLDQKVASSVFGAISSDTGCFKYSNVTPDTHIIASELIKIGAFAEDINYRLFDLKSRLQIEVESLAYKKLEFFCDGKIAFIYISPDDLKNIGASTSDTETVSQLGRAISGVEISVFMRQQEENKYKISVRSNNDYDMSVLCSSFGIGGGHKKAAGCTIIADSPEIAKDAFIEKAKNYLN